MVAWKAIVGVTGCTLACTCSTNAARIRPAHIVVVIEENHSDAEVLGPDSDAPFIRSLADSGAVFTAAHGITHPSQPNYLALFSGSTQGITDNDVPSPMTTPNLGAQLLASKHTFAGYEENLPAVGSQAVSNSADGLNHYVRKHNPWVNWETDSPTGNQLPLSTNQPFSNFPTDFSKLPTVSFVVPDEQNDMHDGSVAQADQWLQSNLGALTGQLAATNTLFILTFDEDDGSAGNQIPMIMAGPMVKAGMYSETVNHYDVLRTIESYYGLPGIGNAANSTAIHDAFLSSTPTPIPEPSCGAILIFAAGAFRRFNGPRFKGRRFKGRRFDWR